MKSGSSQGRSLHPHCFTEQSPVRDKTLACGREYLQSQDSYPHFRPLPRALHPVLMKHCGISAFLLLTLLQHSQHVCTCCPLGPSQTPQILLLCLLCSFSASSIPLSSQCSLGPAGTSDTEDDRPKAIAVTFPASALCPTVCFTEHG